MADDRQRWLREMGARLKLARKAAGLTLEAVGERLVKTKQMVSHYELARGEIGAWELQVFAEMTGVEVGWLITGKATPAVPLASARDAMSVAYAIGEGLLKQPEALFVDILKRSKKLVPTRTRTSALSMALEVPDRGLEPEIAAGDIVVVDAAEKLEPNDVGFFVLMGTGETLARRLETPLAKQPFKIGATNPLFERSKQITAAHKPWGVKVVEVSRVYVAASTWVPGRPVAA